MFVSSSIFGHVLAFINGKITFFGALEVNGNNGITVIKIDPTIKEMTGEIVLFSWIYYFYRWVWSIRVKMGLFYQTNNIYLQHQ